MLARSREIGLRNGVEISTPLLVPSFSSLALAPIRSGVTTEGKPKLVPFSEVHSMYLTREIGESLLISAYDIGHELLAGAHAFGTGFRESDYARPRLLVIDSGWYEKQGSPQGGPFVDGAAETRSWEQEDFERVIGSLDRDAAPAVVNWDCRESYEEQILRARHFFERHSRLASVFLLKPSANSEFHALDELSAEHMALLKAFDIIGVTEREIGDSIYDRLMNIAKLRKSLDTTGVSIPIHIFGGLDPLLTPLYFACGAEIFDGLGWLRYAYREGVAMHRTAGGLLSERVRERSRSTDFTVWRQNLMEIRQLSENMRQFVGQGGNWDVLGTRSESLRAIIEDLPEEVEA